jgi:hypothetical protein
MRSSFCVCVCVSPLLTFECHGIMYTMEMPVCTVFHIDFEFNCSQITFRFLASTLFLKVTTNPMQQSPSCEGSICSGTQYISYRYRTQGFIAVFIRTFVSWPRWLHSIPSHIISLRFVLVLSSRLCLRLPTDPLLLRFQTKCSLAPISDLSYVCYMPHPSLQICFLSME